MGPLLRIVCIYTNMVNKIHNPVRSISQRHRKTGTASALQSSCFAAFPDHHEFLSMDTNTVCNQQNISVLYQPDNIHSHRRDTGIHSNNPGVYQLSLSLSLLLHRPSCVGFTTRILASISVTSAIGTCLFSLLKNSTNPSATSLLAISFAISVFTNSM